MDSTYNPLDLSVQTLYAELLTSLLADADAGEIPAGSLVKKQVKGRTYWYAQYSEAGKQRQVYLGPESETLTQRLKELRTFWSASREDAASRATLVSMLRSAGVIAPDNASATVLEVLARHGVFAVGAVLVGSHAFAAFGAMLGVRWGRGWRTGDIDIAKDSRLRLALADPVDLPAALVESRLPFREVPSLNRKHPSTSFTVRGRQLSVDVLTPLVGPPVDGPIQLPKLEVAAQPLRFLDYLIEDHQPAALVAKNGILVNVPDPARFALHKLVVADERPVAFQAKAAKDLVQAGQLVRLLADTRPGDLERAWAALVDRGPGWSKRVQASRTRLDQAARDALADVVGD